MEENTIKRPCSSLVALLALGLTLSVGCSGADQFSGSGNALTGKDRKDADDDADVEEDEGTLSTGATGDEGGGGDAAGIDDPVWVNGTMLTCDWLEARPPEDVAVLCRVTAVDGTAFAPEQLAALAWKVTVENGGELVVPSEAAPNGDAAARVFVVKARDAGKLSVAVARDGAAQESAKVVTLVTQLPGLKDGPELQACFDQGDDESLSVADCLAKLPPKTNAVVAPGGGASTQATNIRRIFVSSAKYTGVLGGVAGADKRCSDLAIGSALGSTWRAVLSASVNGQNLPLGGSQQALGVVPLERDFVDMRGNAIANGRSDLFDGGLQRGIVYDERNEEVPANDPVWTGATDTGGISDRSCGNWTALQSVGALGKVGSTSTTWLDDGLGQPCNVLARIYCVEIGTK